MLNMMKLMSAESVAFLRKLSIRSIMERVATYEEVSKVASSPGVYLIEIREPNEVQQTGLIPGSIHIPMGQVEAELTKLESQNFVKKYGVEQPKSDAPIIFTCRSGRRAEIAMQDLEKLGFTKYYAGSWLEWESKAK